MPIRLIDAPWVDEDGEVAHWKLDDLANAELWAEMKREADVRGVQTALIMSWREREQRRDALISFFRAGFNGLSDDEQEVVVALSVNWEGTLSELLEAARIV